MNKFFRSALLALTVAVCASASFAQYVPGAQPIVFPTYQPAGQTFHSVTAQTGASLTSSSLRSAIIQVAQTGPTAAVAAPVITGTTTSIPATFTGCCQH